jgi:ankyrin repeat protein
MRLIYLLRLHCVVSLSSGLFAVSVFAGDKPPQRSVAAMPSTELKQSVASIDFPLMAAARAGDAVRVKEMLAKGANEDGRNSHLETSLFIAASLGHVEVVRILVAVPAGIDIPDRDGRTPLFVAAAAGHWEVVELLLDNGAKPNMSRNTGESALFVAVENRHIEIVRALLQMGALATVTNARGRTPLQIARSQGNEAMTDLLLKYHAKLPEKGTRTIGGARRGP